MVFVNNKKFACESCIKGHRSSACSHTDRPLYEIKKKGRPISQCEKCRQLRQSRRVHSKCNCSTSDAGASRPPVAPSGSKPKRFIPIVPTLPNGLKDALQSSSILPPDARQIVDSLLNPCNCQVPSKCKCRGPRHMRSEDSSGLDVLSQVAELFDRETENSSINETSAPPKARVIARPNSPHRKRRKQNHSPSQEHAKHPHSHHSHAHHVQPVTLPPINISEFQGVESIPTFATIPSISEITSIAGSGCTCGVECSCPGCVEHRGPEHALPEHGACSDGACRMCVDNRQGIALPGIAPVGLLQDFFELAAKLPTPPRNPNGLGVQLDASRVDVYSGRRASVVLPKLCCGGKCACPDGRCNCGRNCGGCCENGEKDAALWSPDEEACPLPPVEPAPAIETAVRRSCCG